MPSINLISPNQNDSLMSMNSPGEKIINEVLKNKDFSVLTHNKYNVKYKPDYIRDMYKEKNQFDNIQYQRKFQSKIYGDD